MSPPQRTRDPTRIHTFRLISPLILSQTNVRPIEEPREIDLIGSDATTKRQVSYRQWRQWQRSRNAMLQKACSRLIYQCTRLDKIIVRLRVPCALLGISLSRNSRKDESAAWKVRAPIPRLCVIEMSFNRTFLQSRYTFHRVVDSGNGNVIFYSATIFQSTSCQAASSRDAKTCPNSSAI